MSVGWLDPHGRAREGNRLYGAGKFDDAAEQFNQALVDDPDSAGLHLSLGDARYKAGKFDDAQTAFQKVPATPDDPGRAARLAYNLGNTKFRQGEAVQGTEPQRSLQLWSDALVDYRRALGAQPDDQDAKFNHELVERKIAVLKKKLDEQKQEQEEKEKKQKQDQDQQQQGKGDQQQDKQEEGQKQQQDQQGEQQQSKDQQKQQADQQQGGADQQDQEQKQGDEQQPSQSGEQDKQQDAREGAQPQEAQQQPQQQREEGASGAEGAGARRPSEMTPQEAAALLDALRNQEVQPGDINKRLQGARVAEPREDW